MWNPKLGVSFSTLSDPTSPDLSLLVHPPWCAPSTSPSPTDKRKRATTRFPCQTTGVGESPRNSYVFSHSCVPVIVSDRDFLLPTVRPYSGGRTDSGSHHEPGGHPSSLLSPVPGPTETGRTLTRGSPPRTVIGVRVVVRSSSLCASGLDTRVVLSRDPVPGSEESRT